MKHCDTCKFFDKLPEQGNRGHCEGIPVHMATAVFSAGQYYDSKPVNLVNGEFGCVLHQPKPENNDS